MVGCEQATISFIERHEIESTKAVVPLCAILEIPPPSQFVGDEMDKRWLDAGRVLRRVNEAGFRGLLTAAEQMIVGSAPSEH